MEKVNNPSEYIQNVVLVSFDSLRSDAIAEVNPSEAPNFSLMRDKGAFFKNTIVQAPFTVPSHVSMLSGLYPAKTGVHDMHHRMHHGVSTIFSILKENGFCVISSAPRGGLFERVGFKGVDQRIPFRHKCLKKSLLDLKGKRFFAFLHYWGTHTPYETRLPGFHPLDLVLNLTRPTDRFEGIRYLRRISGALWLARVNRIRAQMKRGDKRILPAVRKGYQASIFRADRYLAGVLKTLEETTLAKNTLVVVTGDHGDSFNEHGEIDRAVGLRYEHGQFLYDNILKVPLILYCEGREYSHTFDAQIQEIDIVPTLLDALGIAYAGSFDGRSLWSQNILEKREPDGRLAFSEVVRESFGVELRCVRSHTSKLICDYKADKFELYDLKTDPEEKKNLYPQDTNGEKEALFDQLQSFSRMDKIEGESYSDSEKETIEKTLRDLGYMD